MTEPPNAPPQDDLTTLVQRHQAEVWRYVRYLGAQSAEADDLTQEVFLAVARKPFTQQSTSETAAYLRTVARNQLLMLRRRQRRETSQLDLATAEKVWAEQAADGRWDPMVAALSDCTEQLEGRSRQAIDLQYREGASRETIAERLGMKPDGVKTLLRRVRDKLRDCIERRLQSGEPSA